jgi:hypothetical protein
MFMLFCPLGCYVVSPRHFALSSRDAQCRTCLAYIYPGGFFDHPPLSSFDPWHEHAFQMLRSAVSYFGQIAMWVTSWNLMLSYYGDPSTSIYPSLMLMGFGLALLFATRTFLLTAWLDMLDDDYDDDDPPTVLFYIRVTFSIMGQFMNNTGFWNILESFVTPTGAVLDTQFESQATVPMVTDFFLLANGSRLCMSPSQRSCLHLPASCRFFYVAQISQTSPSLAGFPSPACPPPFLPHTAGWLRRQPTRHGCPA